MAKIDYGTQVVTLKGVEKDLSDYKGKVLLIVNTASKCGFTPQFEGLETLYKKHVDNGLVILGFPCNQFGKQEPGTADEIAGFCQLNYGVSFPMFGKIEVNGSQEHDLYRQLKNARPGVLGTKQIKWNFTKFLIGRDGEIIRRFGSRTTPEALETHVEEQMSRS